MADMWTEDVEFSDLFGDAESDWEYYDGDAESSDLESEDGEASAAQRRRRNAERRRRQLEQIRRRRQQAAPRAPRRGQLVPARRDGAPAAKAAATGGAPAAQAAAAAIREVDLESKVRDDAVLSALAAANKRTSQAEYAAVAAVLASQIQRSFGDVFKNAVAQAVVAAAPLLLLSPKKKGTGLTAYALDPRVVGGVLVGGTLLADHLRKKGAVVRQIRVTPSPVVLQAPGRRQLLLADVLDDRGAVIAGKLPEWTSSDDATATVDPKTGVSTTVTSVRAGSVFITAKLDDVVANTLVTVGEGEAVVREIRITPSEARLRTGSNQVFFADIIDDRGAIIAGKLPAWTSSDDTIATLDPKTGQTTTVTTSATHTGSVFITAQLEGILSRVLVTVTTTA